MKLWTLGLMGLGLVFAGCDDGTDDKSGETGMDETGMEMHTGDTSMVMPEMEVVVNLTAGGVELVITNGGDPAGYTFGMAQTGTENGWFGEDCFEGTGSFNLCHPASTTGVTLTEVSAAGDVVEGSTTLFNSDDNATLTYVLTAAGSTDCWVWGDDVAYYESFGCTDISGM